MAENVPARGRAGRSREAPRKPSTSRRYPLEEFLAREAVSAETLRRWARRGLAVVTVRYTDPALDNP